MADNGDKDVNLSALQLVDPYIVEVLSSATQVALYKFRLIDNQWDKTDVAGTLFVYRRSAPPIYGFLIMSRLNKTNQVEPITKELEMKKEVPYLMYRNIQLNIFGIWFYDINECNKINDVITKLLTCEFDKHLSQQQIRSPGVNKGGENPDIFSMLSKAQEIYLKNATSDPKPIVESPNAGAAAAASAVRPRAVRVGGAPDVTRISPAAVSSSETAVTEGEKKQLTIEDLFATACDISTGSGKGNQLNVETNSQHNPILQRLMSNPENLVEHIEKRQRNETSLLTNLSKENPKVTTDISISSSTETKLLLESSSPPKYEMDSIFTPAMFESLCTSEPENLFSTPIKIPPSSAQNMSLMSPMMFSTPPSFIQDRKLPLIPDLEDDDEVEPLTKAQLTQALIHLLKNDSSFVNKLHEAYVQTLQKRNTDLNGWENKNGIFKQRR